MADVYTVLFIMIGILLSLPALLVALNLLLPRVTGRASTRLAKTPGWCFVMGIPVAAAIALIVTITASIPLGPVRAIAWVVGIGGAGLGTLGAAGMARLLGERISNVANPNSNLTNLVRGAVVYELACLFPIVGWFIFAPIIGVTVLGAITFSLLRWDPRQAELAQPMPAAPNVAEQIRL